MTILPAPRYVQFPYQIKTTQHTFISTPEPSDMQKTRNRFFAQFSEFPKYVTTVYKTYHTYFRAEDDISGLQPLLNFIFISANGDMHGIFYFPRLKWRESN